MNNITYALKDVFAKNRAEEFGYDVGKHFVVPRFFHNLDLKRAKKPRVIIGGRGCGKTMLLRYLSHKTMFSKKKEKIVKEDLKHIGLYWRADTQFCNAMIKRSIESDIWSSAFNHFAAIVICREVLNSLRSVAESNYEGFDLSDLNELDFKSLSAFGVKMPSAFKAAKSEMNMLLWEFEGWVNDVRKREEPVFLPGKEFVTATISTIKEQCNSFKEAVFYVYLDEYENLCTYQKEIINTWLKHSESPLIFNLAMKRNSFDTKNTVGNESLSDIHDYRQHDLEQYLLEEDFQSFAAEILFLNLSFLKYKDLPIDVNILRDENSLMQRKTEGYIKNVKLSAQKILPDVSVEEMAIKVFEDKALSQKLFSRIEQALKSKSIEIDANRFFRPNLPEATIVIPALIYRKRMNVDSILKELDKLESGKENRFSGVTNWIHNNFIGSYLQLYAPYSRACPFYAGFKTFCSLSRGNIRHFLELCHKSILRQISPDSYIQFPIEPFNQAEAARQASIAFLGEIRSFGKLGNRIHSFVLRVGSLFEIAHRRVTQSESEQSHFSIKEGEDELTDQEAVLLREASKWSVLFEQPQTKKKDSVQHEGIEYVLNPIYAPYFHISYRKKRKLELSVNDVKVLIGGDLSEYKKLLRIYTQRFSVETSAVQRSLFTFMDIEE